MLKCFGGKHVVTLYCKCSTNLNSSEFCKCFFFLFVEISHDDDRDVYDLIYRA